jgi:hypothetical protein
MIINTVTSIAQEIYEEMGEPDDFSIAAIAAWVRRNIGGLSNILNIDLEVNSTTFEISPNLSDMQKYIFKKMYSVYYFDIKIKSIGSLATTDFITIKDDIGNVQKANKNEVLRNYITVRKQEYQELKELTAQYKSNSTSPLQVSGDDILEAYYNPSYTNALYKIRNIYSS